MVGLAAFLAADRTGFRGELEPDFCTACSARPHPGVSADSNRPMRCPCCPTAALRHVSIGALFFGAKTSVFRRRVPAPAAQGRPVGPEAARGVPPGARQVAARRPLQQGAPLSPPPPVRARFAGRPRFGRLWGFAPRGWRRRRRRPRLRFLGLHRAFSWVCRSRLFHWTVPRAPRFR